MTEPYTAAMISGILRAMPKELFARVRADDFRRWPTRGIVPAKIIDELISNERQRRLK